MCNYPCMLHLHVPTTCYETGRKIHVKTTGYSSHFYLKPSGYSQWTFFCVLIPWTGPPQSAASTSVCVGSSNPATCPKSLSVHCTVNQLYVS